MVADRGLRVQAQEVPPTLATLAPTADSHHRARAARLLVVCTTTALALGGCGLLGGGSGGSASSGPDAGGPPAAPGPAGPTTPRPSATASPSPSSGPGATGGEGTASPGPAASGTGDDAAAYRHPKDGVALPDGFVPRRLKKGEKPPQMVVVSFDGVGWDEKWQEWFGVAQKVPFRFTGFLSGTYLLSEKTKKHYDPPRFRPGASAIGWNSPKDLPVEITNLNHAVATGNEIGTHFNGHFCGAPNGGSTWNQKEWDAELDQFFALLRNYRANNGLPASTKLDVTAADIMGERTPCLEGKKSALYPALKAHGITYDSTFVHPGIAWPHRKDGIWELGMASFPIHGSLPAGSPVPAAKRPHHVQITMDYNFWYSQRGAQTASPAEAARDSQQVLDTYRDMYAATYHGNRAPLILGNHFNAWNHGAYSDAVKNFVLETCGKKDTQCVPFRDLVAWLDVQTPATLARLQALPAETR